MVARTIPVSSTADFRKVVLEAVEPHTSKGDEKTLKLFLDTIHYVRVDAMSDDGWAELTQLVEKDPRPVRTNLRQLKAELWWRSRWAMIWRQPKS